MLRRLDSLRIIAENSIPNSPPYNHGSFLNDNPGKGTADAKYH